MPFHVERHRQSVSSARPCCSAFHSRDCAGPGTALLSRRSTARHAELDRPASQQFSRERRRCRPIGHRKNTGLEYAGRGAPTSSNAAPTAPTAAPWGVNPQPATPIAYANEPAVSVPADSDSLRFALPAPSQPQPIAPIAAATPTNPQPFQPATAAPNQGVMLASYNAPVATGLLPVVTTPALGPTPQIESPWRTPQVSPTSPPFWLLAATVLSSRRRARSRSCCLRQQRTQWFKRQLPCPRTRWLSSCVRFPRHRLSRATRCRACGFPATRCRKPPRPMASARGAACGKRGARSESLTPRRSLLAPRNFLRRCLRQRGLQRRFEIGHRVNAAGGFI